MEFRYSTTFSTNLQLSPSIPQFTWKNKINPSRLTINPSRKLTLINPSRLSLFQVSAHLRRPSTGRQNYLRKKLTQRQHQQVSSPTQNPPHQFDKHDVDNDPNLVAPGERSDCFEKSIGLDDESSLFDQFSEKGKNFESTSSRDDSGLQNRQFGESIMWNKLESWVEQYKKDSEFWGIGTGPVFTVYQNSEGKVERVVVNEDEIFRRCRVGPLLDSESEELEEINYKISFARDLARETENGSDVIPKNSSVAKFLLSGEEPRLTSTIQGVVKKPISFPRISKVGLLVVCGLVVVWAVRGLFAVGKDGGEYTSLEKEMLRRKMKARQEKERMIKGSVEVIPDRIEPEGVAFTRPQLDKEELVSSIMKAKGSNSNELGIVEFSGYQNKEFNDKIEEIRAMARQAREIEKKESSPRDGDEEDDQPLNRSETAIPENDPTVTGVYAGEPIKVTEITSLTDPKDESVQSNDDLSVEKSEGEFSSTHNVVSTDDTDSLKHEILNSSNSEEVNINLGNPGYQSGTHETNSRKKLRIIKSAKEAKEYLSRKHKQDVNEKLDIKNDEQVAVAMPSVDVASGHTGQVLSSSGQVHESSSLGRVHEFSHPSGDYSTDSEPTEGNVGCVKDLKISRISSGHEVSASNQDAGISVSDIPGQKEKDTKLGGKPNLKNRTPSFLGGTPNSTSREVDSGNSVWTQEESAPLEKHNSDNTEDEETLVGLQMTEISGRSSDLAPSVTKENWIEKNFHEFEPIVEKIGVGFRDNYHVARERASQELDPKAEIMELKTDLAETEFEWMKDERLREIVFKVRDNELSGRDPFHLMDEEDKRAFFCSLEKKVEQENEKLLNLHEYFHSNIENLDYGADGISLYDPPEKIIPRWKVPPAEKNPEFLENFVEQRNALVTESLKNAVLSKKTGKDTVPKSEEHSSQKTSNVPAKVSNARTKLGKKDPLVSAKTIIEGSDGSIRVGKKSGKEYWEHTKKWSEGFLESYNAESDPEVKAVMKDIGKDLDRWITEKEIQEAADLMNKIPEKGQKFIKQKLDKVKREMELFGPQAVVSKYREYAEEKAEDYLWWLDLPFVLCIELYTVEDGEQRVGFYSLEMAPDLELDPKPYHVIAFENPGDCKNLCYIIQAKMEMLGNGNAFVVARPPKDVFREAKANGFGVTVVRKGELQLNIDQTLEEVEESIVEIGSKIYHDQITRERSVDINGLMKGVFGVTKPTKSKRKRSKRKLKRRIKP